MPEIVGQAFPAQPEPGNGAGKEQALRPGIPQELWQQVPGPAAEPLPAAGIREPGYQETEPPQEAAARDQDPAEAETELPQEAAARSRDPAEPGIHRLGQQDKLSSQYRSRLTQYAMSCRMEKPFTESVWNGTTISADCPKSASGTSWMMKTVFS